MTAYQPNPQVLASPTAPPPGWYRDPSGVEGERWWTGMQWSEHARQADPAAGLGILVPQPSTYPTRALVWGIVAVAVPLAFIPSLMAIYFGAFSLAREKAREQQGLPSKRNRSIAGIILGSIGLALIVAFFVVLGMSRTASACGC